MSLNRWWARLRGKSQPPETMEVTQARDRLEAANLDDKAVDAVMNRVEKVMRENNLAPYVMRALGVRRP